MRLIVVGGGAAGFFCAVTAARMNPDLQVLLVERSAKLLSKVRISGGGRCNVTHACYSIPEMIRNYPRGMHFVKKAFHEFFTEDTVAWFRQRGVALKTEKDGRMFPVSDQSATIVDCLLREADRYKVSVRLNRDVRSLSRTGGRWVLGFADGTIEEADRVCVACGGYPKAGMFDWLRDTGHTIQPPVPSLFTFNMPGNDLTTLMGISTRARVRIRGGRLEEEGPVLVTHWGLSGPAVLKLSARGARELAAAGYRFGVVISWCPGFNEESLRQKFRQMRTEHSGQKTAGRNDLDIPQRLWEHLCCLSGIAEGLRWADLSSAQLNQLIKNVLHMELEVQGKTTFKEEFVTAGGITLSEVNPATMESRLAKGLYFAGEILDVDGITGGFNFQHAWTSGWIAGKNCADFLIFAPPN